MIKPPPRRSLIKRGSSLFGNTYIPQVIKKNNSFHNEERPGMVGLHFRDTNQILRRQSSSFEDLGDFHIMGDRTNVPSNDFDIISDSEFFEMPKHIHANGLDFKTMLNHQEANPK
jgi:hypothetical protein